MPGDRISGRYIRIKGKGVKGKESERGIDGNTEDGR